MKRVKYTNYRGGKNWNQSTEALILKIERWGSQDYLTYMETALARL